MSHNAAAVRDRKGKWSLWSPVCPTCDWTSPAMGREDAQSRAEDHNLIEAVREIVASLTCDCFHPDEAEFYPDYTCPKCRLEEALGLERAS